MRKRKGGRKEGRELDNFIGIAILKGITTLTGEGSSSSSNSSVGPQNSCSRFVSLRGGSARVCGAYCCSEHLSINDTRPQAGDGRDCQATQARIGDSNGHRLTDEGRGAVRT
ncbi:hypothetical protein E2C01_045744 [Portunus trituberculatus]|uniref:Uncharacterized protein n=1 Tax=Portunus trituberculatus TaxID=210409 RepID=A0A5B7G2V4_PORTR|nr:hypothetical protein [Portunus trituberculatus]